MTGPEELTEHYNVKHADFLNAVAIQEGQLLPSISVDRKSLFEAFRSIASAR